MVTMTMTSVKDRWGWSADRTGRTEGLVVMVPGLRMSMRQ